MNFHKLNTPVKTSAQIKRQDITSTPEILFASPLIPFSPKISLSWLWCVWSSHKWNHTYTSLWPASSSQHCDIRLISFHSTDDGHSHYFWIVAALNKAEENHEEKHLVRLSTNICMHFCWTYAQEWNCWIQGEHLSTFSETRPNTRCTKYDPCSSSVLRVPVAPRPHQHSIFSMIFILAILAGVYWHLVELLFCIPLMTNDVFMCLQAPWRTSFVIDLFKVSCPFSTGCLSFSDRFVEILCVFWLCVLCWVRVL